MKQLLLVWKIIILFQCKPSICMSDVSLISSLKFGEYKLIFKQIFKCNSSQVYKIQFNHYIIPTANSTKLKGNITMLIPYDDTMSIEINMAMRDSFGNWKDNTIIQKSPNACSKIKLGFGNSWNKYLNSFGINNTACPISPV
ncbi:uncharacterized protein LOC111038828 isoform X2 [Myzus persicae]|uniref:uncharacterized protein LOC111038828 isoform X2 n=1 Tax=Myzus persicae TaxID=13164 RepID=UPI000B93057A|nr:uncharacterized protein LOC111038828 isoform X2 [Myzus persicae]